MVIVACSKWSNHYDDTSSEFLWKKKKSLFLDLCVFYVFALRTTIKQCILIIVQLYKEVIP